MDLRRGTRLEVEAYTGAVFRHGARLGVPTPVHQALTEILTGLADGRERPETWRGNPAALLERAGLAPIPRR
jgi:hypothetical protein